MNNIKNKIVFIAHCGALLFFSLLVMHLISSFNLMNIDKRPTGDDYLILWFSGYLFLFFFILSLNFLVKYKGKPYLISIIYGSIFLICVAYLIYTIIRGIT